MKPEKRECVPPSLGCNEETLIKKAMNDGYNQACDDYEKFLPSEDEIKQIVVNTYETNANIAKTIAKRIGVTK